MDPDVTTAMLSWHVLNFISVISFDVSHYKLTLRKCLWWLTQSHNLPVMLSRHASETKMSSFWYNFHHWLHRKLSFWQLSVQPVMKISSKWRHFRFSVVIKTRATLIVRIKAAIIHMYTRSPLVTVTCVCLFVLTCQWALVPHVDGAHLLQPRCRSDPRNLQVSAAGPSIGIISCQWRSSVLLLG